MQTVTAYFDGQTIKLNEPLKLSKNDKLLVTKIEESTLVASDNEIEYAAVSDINKDDFLTKEELAYYKSLK